MSDYFQSYVFGELVAGHSHGDFQRVPAFLLSEQIMGEKTANNTLEGDGHVPGLRAATILTEDNGYWRLLDVKGVRVEQGRIIEFSSELEHGRCPHCHVEIEAGTEAFQPIDDALSAFNDGHGDDVECPNCRARSKLSQWDFGNGLAVGYAMVKFWNWPDIIEGLNARFEALAAMKCKKIWGKL